MDDQRSGKADWQVALGHHEDLCAERYNNLDKCFDAVVKRLDNIEKLQRITIGLILAGYFAWSTALIAFLKFF